MIAVPESANGRRVWRCTNCNHHGEWADGWAWYGRYGGRRDTQEHVIEEVLCPRCSPRNPAVYLDSRNEEEAQT